MSPHHLECVCPECELDREIDNCEIRVLDVAELDGVYLQTVQPIRRGWNRMERDERGAGE